MRNYIKILLTLFIGLSLFSGSVVSKNVTLDAIKAFPVAKELKTITGDPVSVIDTGIITGERGIPARGPHEIIFSLDASAPYGVIVSGEKIKPGE